MSPGPVDLGIATMSTLMLSAKLDRSDGGTPWGFRMHGGKDFGCPLTIQRVRIWPLVSIVHHRFQYMIPTFY